MAATLTPKEIAYQKLHIKDDQGPGIKGVSIALIVITALMISFRFVARKIRALPFEWDDWFSIGGLIFVIMMCVINIISVRYGLGRHFAAITGNTEYKVFELGFYLSIAYAFGHWFIKMSILFLYKRIFSLRTLWFKVAFYFWVAYVSAWTFAHFIVIVAQCRPLNYLWERLNPARQPPIRGVCTVNSQATVVSISALNTAADFMLLLLPVTMLWQIKLHLARKVALMFVFSIGSFACIAGVFRLVYTLNSVKTVDLTWSLAKIYLWTAVEAAVALICACFPIVGPMYTIVRDKIRSNYSFSRNKSGTGSRSYVTRSSVMKGDGYKRSRQNSRVSPVPDPDSSWIRLEEVERGNSGTSEQQ